ncbi:MAG: fumarylacetoacetate hydrolase family protein [Deltaproteobacteria bacterium]|nr:fumarylacetoacetate hydrolase family protein [Deltaproteobacteria bacterium]
MSLQEVADALFVAEQHCQAIDKPSDGQALSIDDAYAIQQINVQRRVAKGSRLVGRKIGITSKAVMEWLKVTEPDFGALLDDMIVDDGGTCLRSSLLQARVEGEIAFVLEKDLDLPRCTAVDVVGATAWIATSIEIIDSRVKDWKLTLQDTVADNASSARFVLSSTKTKLRDLDLPLVGCALRKNGRVASSGAGAACLGNPVNAVVWLARTLALRGTPLRAGDVVLSGALCPVVPVEAGDVVDVDVRGVGRCSVRFN